MRCIRAPVYGLSEEAKGAVWRIFGSGASPMRVCRIYDRIVPVISAFVPEQHQDRDIAELQGWFEEDHHSERLKADFEQRAARLIVDGSRGRVQEDATWAVAAIDADVMASLIQSRWSTDEVGAFVTRAMTELERACERNVVLDASRWGQVEIDEAAKARVPRDAIEKEGRLATLRHVQQWTPDLVFRGVRPSVSTLVALVLELQPESFLSVVNRVDHPVLHVHLSWRRREDKGLPSDEDVLDWISRDATDSAIAFAIWETLEAMSARSKNSSSGSGSANVADTGMASVNAGSETIRAGVDPLTILMNRLSGLDASRSARWIGEVLGHVSRAFGRTVDGQKPSIVEVAELGGHAAIRDQLDSGRVEDTCCEFAAGLRSGGERRWHRHQAALAWDFRKASPDLAVKLATGVLEAYRSHLGDENRYVDVDWQDWVDREWIESLGRAVALTNRESDVHDWAVAQCRGLPLTAWDAEEETDRFLKAEKIADTWFLIAFMAVEASQEQGRPVEPAAVRRLAERYWSHCGFVDGWAWNERTNGIGAEIAARYAAHFGKACGVWILQQARTESVGVRAIWGLLSQRESDEALRVSVSTDVDEEFVGEMTVITGRRFSDGEPFQLAELELWGRLWLCLRAVDQAEETAREILLSQPPMVDRRHELMALKLLAMVMTVRATDDGLRRFVVPLYEKVWPARAGTPSEEETDRREVVEALVAAGFLKAPD